jgi:hypothetical protein
MTAIAHKARDLSPPARIIGIKPAAVIRASKPVSMADRLARWYGHAGSLSVIR